MNIFDEEGLINSEVQEILYELGNVGLGMASITIGKIMGMRMHIGVPKIVPVEKISVSKLEGLDDEVSIWMHFQKTLSGGMLFVLKKDFINDVVGKMAEADAGISDDTERVSVIQEFANIICAAYLKAVGQYTGMRIYVKPAGLKIQKGDQALIQAYESLKETCDKAICVDTGFSLVHEDGKIIDNVGHVIMLPDEQSVEKLIEPLCD